MVLYFFFVIKMLNIIIIVVLLVVCGILIAACYFVQRLYPKNLDVMVVSAGGGGTTYFMEYLSEYTSLNHSSNWDGLKHASYLDHSRIKECKP